MAAYELLLLNTAIPQIQAAQSGDTYVVPRDIAFSTVASFAAGAEATPSIVATGDTNTGIWFPAADTVAISTGGISRMRLDSSGNLGLGVTPSAWSASYKVLQLNTQPAVWGSSDALFVTVNQFQNTSGSNRYIADGFATQYRQDGGQHQWYNAPSGTAGNAISFTQAMTLDASGNLLLGLTSGTAKFDMAVGAGAAVAAIRVRSLSTNSNGFNIVTDSVTDNIYLNNFYNAAMLFGTSNTERARITSGGNLDLQKNIGLGGASATTSGTGITFPATQSASSDANTLDDYEEGVFVATITTTSGSITLKGTSNELAYTKVGRLVTVTGMLIVDSVSTPSGGFTINNLPFPVGTLSENSESVGFAFVLQDAPSYTGSLILGVIDQGATSIATNLDASTVGADDQVRVSFSYFA